jgi:hypothetical protein
MGLNPPDPFGREIDDLLPFYVTGRLSLADMQRVEKALHGDPASRMKLELVLEEQAATVQVNEAFGRPPSDAVDRFFAVLPTESSRRRPFSALQRSLSWIGQLPALLAPRAFPCACLAASLAVLVQAAVIGELLTRPEPPHVYTPQAPPGEHEGCVALAAFNSDAKLSDIAARLTTVEARIIDGPIPGGLYLIRIGSELGAADCVRTISQLAADKRLSRFAGRSI